MNMVNLALNDVAMVIYGAMKSVVLWHCRKG
jgi:hypothetical protein